jgi:hypothetical protein
VRTLRKGELIVATSCLYYGEDHSVDGTYRVMEDFNPATLLKENYEQQLQGREWFDVESFFKYLCLRGLLEPLPCAVMLFNTYDNVEMSLFDHTLEGDNT